MEDLKVEVERYDRAQRIVYISRPESPQRGFDTSPSEVTERVANPINPTE